MAHVMDDASEASSTFAQSSINAVGAAPGTRDAFMQIRSADHRTSATPGSQLAAPTIGTLCGRAVSCPDCWAEPFPVPFHARWKTDEEIPVSSSHRTDSDPKPARTEEQSELRRVRTSAQLLWEKLPAPSSSLRTCGADCRWGRMEFRPSSIHSPTPYGHPVAGAADLRNSERPTRNILGR